MITQNGPVQSDAHY